MLRIVTVMTNDRKSIPPMHLEGLMIMLLHMNLLFVRHLRPVRVTRKRRFYRMAFEINLVSGGVLVLVQFLEERTPVVIELRKRGRMLPIVGRLWEERIVVDEDVMIDIEVLFIILR